MSRQPGEPIDGTHPARDCGPSHYSPILNIFERFKVTRASDLEKLLAASQMSGAVCGDYVQWANHTSGDELAQELCQEVSRLAENAGSMYGLRGIQQFSLSADSRVEELNLRKALFLANSATIIAPHEVRFTYECMTGQAGQDLLYQSWEVNEDFVRDLFMHRELLRDGSLVLLPRGADFRHLDRTTEYPGTEYRSVGLEPLLEEVSATRVLELSVDASLLDRIIAQYRRNNQLVVLPDMQVPWVNGITLGHVLDIRMDHHEELSRFQRAYHQAVLDFIENHQSLDFAAISDAINGDVIGPTLQSLERSYKRTLSVQRSLTTAGAAVGTLPVAGAIISGELLNSISTTALASGATSFIAVILGAFAANRIQRKNAAAAIEDSTYAVLWRVGGPQPKT